MGKNIRSEERTNIFGDKYTVHYDEHGNKIGTSEKRKNIFGDEYTAHYDKNSNKTGTSENRKNIFGDEYTAHYDKYSNNVGTSEKRTNIFGDEYVAHYDNMGNKVGESYNQTDIFGNSYSQYYGSDNSSGSGSYSDPYSNPYSNPYTGSSYSDPYATKQVTAPKKRETYKMTGGSNSISDATLKKFNSAKLNDEMFKAFAWYVSGLLKNKKVPFDRKVAGAGLWKTNTYSESYESENHYKDEETTTYLCEHGFAWEIEVRSGSEIGRYEKYSCEKERIKESLIDYLLDKNGIAFSSRDFANMPSELKDRILAEYENSKSAIDAGRKSIHFNNVVSDIQKNPNYYQKAERFPIGPVLLIVAWIIESIFLFTTNLPSGETSVILAILGLWLISRYKEYLRYTVAMSGFIFACAVGSASFINPVPAMVVCSILAVAVVFVLFERVGPNYNQKMTETCKEGIIVASASELVAVLNLPAVAHTINNTLGVVNANTGICKFIYISLAIWGLVGLVQFIIHMYKKASDKNKDEKSRLMVRSHLWCLLFGLIPPVIMLILQFIPPLIGLGISIIALITICIKTIKMQSYPKMASRLIAFPTVFCIFMGMFSNCTGYGLQKIFDSIYCGFILDFFKGFGGILKPVTMTLAAPVNEAIYYLINLGHGIPGSVLDYIESASKVTPLFAFIVVSVVCSIGGAIAKKRNTSKAAKNK